jgi:hypothetical protein
MERGIIALMPQSRLDLVKTLEGVGSLLIDGRVTPVRYSIKIFQEMLQDNTGREVPGLRSAAGQLLDLKPTDAARAIGHAVQLTLQDGQRSEVIVTDATGAVQVSGSIG